MLNDFIPYFPFDSSCMKSIMELKNYLEISFLVRNFFSFGLIKSYHLMLILSILFYVFFYIYFLFAYFICYCQIF